MTRLIALLTILALPLAAAPAFCTIYVVRSDGSGDFPTIQAAINAVTDGDIIELADGTFTGPGNRDIGWGSNMITVRSQSDNPLACIIDCQGSAGDPHHGFSCGNEEANQSLLRGVTVRNGYAVYGGGFLMNEAVRIEHCVFTGNTAERGGAVAGMGPVGTGMITDCVMTGNHATIDGGAIYWSMADANVTSCLFAENSAAGRGGALFCGGSTSVLDFTNCTFAGNSAPQGGGICVDEIALTLANSIIAFSTQGEALYCAYASTLQLTCCDIFGNAGGDWVGCIAGFAGTGANFSENPLFCNALNPACPYCLQDGSPCVNRPGCGLVGALGVGCTGTLVEPTTWGRIKAAHR